MDKRQEAEQAVIYGQTQTNQPSSHASTSDAPPPAYEARTTSSTSTSASAGSGLSAHHYSPAPESANAASNSLAMDEVTDVELASLFDIPSALAHVSPSASLLHPVALPQISSRFDAPIARAWVPQLEHFDISQSTWLDFLEGLSYAIVASPPLQVLDMVGAVVGLVPNEWCMVAGIATQFTAQTGQRVLSKGLTDRYLTRANKSYFGPRGLRARLMKAEALRVFTGLEEKGKNPKLRAFGRGLNHVYNHIPLPIIRPIVNGVVQAVKNDPTRLERTEFRENVTARRLARFEGHIASLDFADPAPTKPRGLMDQASSLALKMQSRKAVAAETKKSKQQDMLLVAQGQMSADEYAIRHAGQGPTGFGSARKMAKEDRRVDRMQRRALSGRGPSRKLARRVERAQKDEKYNLDTALWLVVYPAEDDKLIDGVEELDTDEPLEIDEAEFDAVIDLEARELAMRSRRESPQEEQESSRS